jgi:hypothetical protein
VPPDIGLPVTDMWHETESEINARRPVAAAMGGRDVRTGGQTCDVSLPGARRPTPDEFASELRDDKAVWRWYCKYLPRCMALVPARRRSQFVAGVYGAAEVDLIDWP